MPTKSYPKRTEKNVIDSDGTLIVSHGKLTDGSKYTLEMAVMHGRPRLHIDLDRTPAFHAAQQVMKWIDENRIETLNVAGPRASKDPKIYKDTLNILESCYYLSLVQGGTAAAAAGNNPISETANPPPRQPQSINEAVEQLISQIPLKDKATVANMSANELPGLYLTLGEFIMNNFMIKFGTPDTKEHAEVQLEFLMNKVSRMFYGYDEVPPVMVMVHGEENFYVPFMFEEDEAADGIATLTCVVNAIPIDCYYLLITGHAKTIRKDVERIESTPEEVQRLLDTEEPIEEFDMLSMVCITPKFKTSLNRRIVYNMSGGIHKLIQHPPEGDEDVQEHIHLGPFEFYRDDVPDFVKEEAPGYLERLREHAMSIEDIMHAHVEISEDN